MWPWRLAGDPGVAIGFAVAECAGVFELGLELRERDVSNLMLHVPDVSARMVEHRGAGSCDGSRSAQSNFGRSRPTGFSNG